jgi:hypothetical protein
LIGDKACRPGNKSRAYTERGEDIDAASEKADASSNVLVLLSLMYFITNVDRVAISTAAPAIKREFGPFGAMVRQGVRFAPDSPLEESGFELSVPS